MSLITEAMREFLQKTLIARMTTIGVDGYPHTVPVWFGLDGDDIIVISTRDTRKVRNVLANPKGAITIGGDDGDGGGYLCQGDFAVEEDPGFTWMKALTRRYEEGEKAEQDIADWSELDMIVIRLTPRKIIKVA